MATDVSSYKSGEFKVTFGTTGNQGTFANIYVRVDDKSIPEKNIWVENVRTIHSIHRTTIFGGESKFDDLFLEFHSLPKLSQRTAFSSIEPLGSRKVFVVSKNEDTENGFFTLLTKDTFQEAHKANKAGVLISADRVSTL